MTNQEINHKIVVNIKGWKFVEEGWYDDGSGFYNPLPDYCHSIAHALDLAKTAEVGLAPSQEGWTAYSVNNAELRAENAIPGVAICLCVLKLFDDAEVAVVPKVVA